MSSEYLFSFKTIQSNVIKTLGEALKEILTDANISFNKSGVKICAMDATQTVLVHLKLDSDNFEEYYCSKSSVIGINMQNLFKLLKTMTNNDTLFWGIKKDDVNFLIIKIYNNDKNITNTFKLPLLDLDNINITIPPAEFDSIITLPSSDFQKICRDMHNISDTIEICNAGNLLYFKCNGCIAQQETIMGGSTDEVGLQFVKQSDDKIIQGYYNLKHLVMFTKCTNLCNTIELYMKNDFPIVIKFQVGSLGTLKLAIAPKIND
tara:strand:+ start:765 stop:1553 length:789 start_codon:yes stop_codon:yes gene_type:complete